MIENASKKANEGFATDECISGTADGGIAVIIECDITVSIDNIGRCTRRICHRALVATNAEEETPEPDENDAVVDDDSDEKPDEEVNKRRPRACARARAHS
jgi:hypothetical protein